MNKINSPKKSPNKAPRTPGRPLSGGLDPRERLLDTAVSSFAHVGVTAASLRGIAQQTGVTAAMVNYYFGNKERLLDAVVEERLLPLIRGLAERLQAAGDEPFELVTAFVQGIGETVSAHPWLPPLWVREILCEGGVLRELLPARVAPLLPLLLAQRLSAAQERGEINAQLDPRLLVVSLVGLTLLPYAAAPIWRGFFPDPALGDAALLRHTLALLRHGMEV